LTARWLARGLKSVLAVRQGVRHCSGQLVVGASRRLVSQQWGAAMNGSARPVRLSRSEYIAKETAGPSRLARSSAMPRAMPNYSIERTLPGKPVSASHVKR